MPRPRKMQSVIELARYHVGDVMWWVTFRPAEIMSDLATDDDWMRKHHPKALFQWGPAKILWPKRLCLPKLHHMDFEVVTTLLTSTLIVEQFIICDIVRSRHTGEFFYCNCNDEWMPEAFLLSSRRAANQERTRIRKLFQGWLR